MSAIRPAKIDKIAGVSLCNALITFDNWSNVNIAVTLQIIPSFESSETSSTELSPFVFVIGIFTLTLSPHEEISLAYKCISSKLSANTSNEIGLFLIDFKTSNANSL